MADIETEDIIILSTSREQAAKKNVVQRCNELGAS
jgi:hypothetical protein